MAYQTEQEEFWAGSFGDNYVDRNQDKSIIASNIAIFSRIFARTTGINSIIEFGSNIGLNMVALRQLLPDAELSAIEINKKAASILKERGYVKVYNHSIFDFQTDYQRDLVFTKGVLIHISPDMLDKTYELIYNTSKKYILIAEYYNPTPVEVPYRGNKERLFKRDFAGDLLEKYPDITLIDYGFIYTRDPNHSSRNDDTTWFLLER